MTLAPLTTSTRSPVTRLLRIRVLAGDRNPLFRDAMVRALGRDRSIAVVAEAPDAGEALARIRELRPDVAVLAGELPRLDDVGVLEAVRVERLPTRVLVLAARIDPAAAHDLLAAGASGWVARTADGDELCAAVTAVARGQTVLAREAQNGIASELRLRRRHERAMLSAREAEILRLVADGRSAPDIASHLQLGVGTVKTHLLHLYEKLGVSERAAAVATAMRQGLLE